MPSLEWQAVSCQGQCGAGVEYGLKRSRPAGSETSRESLGYPKRTLKRPGIGLEL